MLVGLVMCFEMFWGDVMLEENVDTSVSNLKHDFKCSSNYVF